MITRFLGTLNQASRIAMDSMSGQQQQDVGFKIPALPAQLECLRHNVACGLQAAGQQLTRAAHGIRWGSGLVEGGHKAAQTIQHSTGSRTAMLLHSIGVHQAVGRHCSQLIEI